MPHCLFLAPYIDLLYHVLKTTILFANIYPFMMPRQRELTKKQIEKLKNQKEKLESLCRSLQAERKQVPFASTPEAPSSQDVAVTSQDS